MFARLIRRIEFPMARLGQSIGLVMIALVLVAACGAWAAEPSRFAVGKCANGQLQFDGGLPVVTTSGTPEQIGAALGALYKQPLTELMGKQEEVAHGFGLKQAPGVLVKMSRLALPSFPDSQRRELQAMATASGANLDTLDFANIMYEISHFPACSSLAVEPPRSATGTAVFGRNLDFPTFGFLDKYSLIVVCRPDGKHAFASITFPSVVGVFSGMNDAGLCIAQLEVNESADNAARINILGTPVAMCFRRLLEECTTVDEAEKLLREQNRMMMCNLAVCDRTQSAVLEITPKTVARRASNQGVCPCTNHFRTLELACDMQCSRYDKLCACQQLDKVGIADVARLLDSANQRQFTIQTMIFEPSSLKAHISFGPAPSSSRPLKEIDLARYLRPEN
jgi:isopenicillin-N N-acyltransferase like protein